MIGTEVKDSRNATVVAVVVTEAVPASTRLPSDSTWSPASRTRYVTSSPAPEPPDTHFSTFNWNVWSVTPEIRI